MGDERTRNSMFIHEMFHYNPSHPSASVDCSTDTLCDMQYNVKRISSLMRFNVQEHGCETKISPPFSRSCE